jgi:uncharacterized membrane protein YfcA
MVVAMLGACLSFFSGFGLGTLLLPAFMLFFPAPLAIAATAVVHMLNNVFKLFLVGKYADKKTVLSFGLLSAVGAFVGALLLNSISFKGVLCNYSIQGHFFQITFIKLIIGILIFAFAILEIAPWFKHVNIAPKWMPVGGLVSGFFGGLSGHQGALRSAFLMKAGLSKEAFLGTRVVIACIVDLTRIAVYASAVNAVWGEVNIYLVVAATLAAFAGAWLGNKWVKKVELDIINNIVSVSLGIFAILLAIGIV